MPSSISDAVNQLVKLVEKIDELLSIRQQFVDRRLKANDDLGEHYAVIAKEKDEELNARQAEMIDWLNARNDAAAELMSHIEGVGYTLETRITGLSVSTQRRQYWEEARRNAAARMIAIPGDLERVFDPLEDIRSQLAVQTARREPTIFNMRDYYVSIFTLVEQARSYWLRLQRELERRFQAWSDSASTHVTAMAKDYEEAFDRAVEKINQEEERVLERWADEWDAINRDFFDTPDTSGLQRSWPAYGPESSVLFSVSGYEDNEDLRMMGVPETDVVRPVLLDDSLVLWTAGKRSVQIAEDQFWRMFSELHGEEFKVCVCSGGGTIDQSAQLTHALKRLPEVSGGKMLTASQDIAQALRSHVVAMEDTFQNKLVGYSSVKEFNQKNPSKPISWQLLYVCHYPAGFDEASTRDLLSLVKQGARAGIRVVVQGDMPDAGVGSYRTGDMVRALRNIPQAFFFDAAEDTWFSCMEGRISMDLPSFNRDNLGMTIEQTATKLQERRNKAIDLLSILPRARFQKCSAAHRISVPIGLKDDGTVCNLEFGDVVGQGSSHFALVVGPTGSGKSVLLHTIIMAALLSYPPSELQVYLMDFKEGTEFKAYADAKLPHVRSVALDSMQQFGESVLGRLTQEMAVRADAFKKASLGGKQIANIAEYRDSGHHMPRILVVIDEFQELFDCDRDRRCANRAAARFAEIVSKGRAFGIHMVLATQTLHHLYEGNYSIARSSLEEMHVRIGLKCSEREYANLMGQDVARLCVEKTDARKGSGVFAVDYVHDVPAGMRAAYLDPSRRSKLLRKLEERYANTAFSPARVFRGSVDVTVSTAVLSQAHRQRRRLYVGQPIAIGKNVGMDVSPQSASNLLVVGENLNMLDRVAVALLCQAAAGAADGARTFLLDADTMRSGMGGSGVTSTLKTLGVSFPASSLDSAQNAFQALPLLRGAYGLYIERRNALATGTADVQTLAPAYFVVLNYHQIDPIMRLMEGKSVADYEAAESAAASVSTDSLQDMLDSLSNELQGASSSADTSTPPRTMLRTLLENGHLCNFHCVFTCGSATVLERLLRGDIAPFNHRMVFPSVGNAHKFVDTDINLKYLQDNCALYTDGGQEAQLVRPFNVVAASGSKQ